MTTALAVDLGSSSGRIIAGTLLEIGQGRRSPEEMEAILLGERREDAGKTAPACGLYLEQVFYDKKEAGL